jgi:hypothetical protein
VKLILVLLVAYAIVGAFHSFREFYRRRTQFPELLHRHPWLKQFPEPPHRHPWFMCGLTWLPTSIVFPLMSPPFGGSVRIWRRENLKDSVVSWLLFAAIVGVGIWGI